MLEGSKNISTLDSESDSLDVFCWTCQHYFLLKDKILQGSFKRSVWLPFFGYFSTKDPSLVYRAVKTPEGVSLKWLFSLSVVFISMWSIGTVPGPVCRTVLSWDLSLCPTVWQNLSVTTSKEGAFVSFSFQMTGSCVYFMSVQFYLGKIIRINILIEIVNSK